MKAQEETVSSEDAWFHFLTGIGHWQWHGFGFFTLILRGEHLPLGRVGLLIPLARKAGSLYGFQFRRNLNLCVHLSWRNRWDEL